MKARIDSLGRLPLALRLPALVSGLFLVHFLFWNRNEFPSQFPEAVERFSFCTHAKEFTIDKAPTKLRFGSSIIEPGWTVRLIPEPACSLSFDFVLRESSGQAIRLGVQVSKSEREEWLRLGREVWSLVVRPWASAIIPTILDPLVVVIFLTTLTADLGILALAIAIDPKNGISQIAITWCVITTLVGGSAIIFQIHRLYRKSKSRQFLNHLIAKGNDIQNAVYDSPRGETGTKFQGSINDWVREVTQFLKIYFPEYVSTFQSEAGLGPGLSYGGTPERDGLINVMDRRVTRLTKLLNEP
jgi:hypothetical protein